MKIAVCLSGHVRTFELAQKSLRRNVLDKYDCDVFLSTWENMGNIRYATHYKTGFDETDERINIDRIKDVYKPVSLLIEDGLSKDIEKIKKPFEFIKTRNGANMDQTISMFYKMWNCNELKKKYEQEHNIKYDLTFRCRFDVYINNVNMEMSTKEVQFISGHCGFNDIVFVGPSNHMNDVCDLYTILSPNIPFIEFENAEQILHDHVVNNEIPYKISSAVDYYFIKPAGVFSSQGQKLCELGELAL